MKLITEQSQNEIESLNKQLLSYQQKEQDFKLNQKIASEIEESNQIKTKQLLVTTKGELEKAATTIKELNNEIKVQQEYYETELQK